MRHRLIVLILASVACNQQRAISTPEPPYVRDEKPAVREFYKSYAPYYESTPADIAHAVDTLQRETQLPRRADTYPVDPPTLARAAKAFEASARQVFGVTLSLASDDAAQLDRLFNAHLIDEKLRRYFDGARLRKLDDRESQLYAKATDRIRVPNEPLLLYCAGAWWGEWLIRHRGFVWQLYPPLRPQQSFPDMITASNTICVHPFSQVTTKLSDPEGDSLEFAAHPSFRTRYFGPYPLIASIADSDHAAATLLPRELRRPKPPFEAFDAYLSSHRGPARVYALAVEAAWMANRLDRVEQWSKTAIELAPENPVLKHNLAVLYSQSKRIPDAIVLLEQALKADPQYGRAHLTLASCLLDTGRTAEAKEHAVWVRDHDERLKADAMKLLDEMKR